MKFKIPRGGKHKIEESNEMTRSFGHAAVLQLFDEDTSGVT